MGGESARTLNKSGITYLQKKIILDDRKSLLIAFLTISNQYKTLILLTKFHTMAAGGHFERPKITFNRSSRNSRSIHNFFGLNCFIQWPLISIAFLAISDQYKTLILLKKITQWPLAAILDDRKSLLIAFLAISDQYPTFFSHKMASGGHFG